MALSKFSRFKKERVAIKEARLKETKVKKFNKVFSEKLKEMGVTIAIITKVKSINESVVTSVNTDPGYGTYGYGGFGGYGGYGGYYSGMYRTGYYHNMNMGYVGGGSSTAITETEKEFVVETLLYDLTLPESEQLLSVVTSLVDDPNTY